MDTNNSLIVSVIIILGVLVFGGSFLAASYFMSVQKQDVEDRVATPTEHPFLGKCEAGTRVYRSFAEAFQEPDEVCSLSITGENLTEVPPEIGSLKNLHYLTLVNNELTTLPPEIGELENLHTLFVSINSITHLPDEIANLKNLKKLEMVRNPLSGAEKSRLNRLLPDVEIIY